MKTLPAYLRKPANFKAGSLDDTTEDYQPLLATWLIEMALSMKWYRMPRPHRLPEVFGDDDFLRVTEITPPAEQDEDGDWTGRTKVDERGFARLLKTRLEALRRCPFSGNLPLFANIELIGGLLGFSNAEKAVLTFATAMNHFVTFRNAVSARNEHASPKRVARVIAMLTGGSPEEMLTAMREDGLLVASGLITVERNVRDFENAVQLGDGFEGMMMLPHASEADVTKRILKPASPATLELSAFPHLVRDIDALQAYLGNAMRGQEKGANVLFYGPPGTGKTELAKAIAARLGKELFEIPFADLDGDPIRGEKRLRAYNLCQKLLAQKQNALLMFDEIEDVFESRGGFWALFGGDADARKGGKAWINRTLERNAMPAIWITNDPEIDPAYLRRFDYSVRFPIPPLKVRIEIARHHMGSFAPNDDWLARVAASEHTMPAQIERAAKVARIAGGEDLCKARALVEQALDRSATLLEQKRAPARNLLRTGYDLAFINTDADIGKLIGGLKQRPRGSFCLYGPAGTGKSEFARHIADELEKPALLRRASDLLSMWVGQSEKHIAAMFAEARQQDAVLILDEADSFLSDRRSARASWEVTQVNELLTQMEAFEGIFICTTNLMQKLDQASLRRFAFKLKFDYLTPDQRWDMFSRELTRLGGKLADAGHWEGPVRRLACLTPGDFAVAARQLELWGTAANAGELYEQLSRECAAKEGASHGIGFTA